MVRVCRTTLVLAFFSVLVAPAAADTIIIDGELLDAGMPANGVFDFRFRCFFGADAESSEQLGRAIDKDDVQVRIGRFQVELDFGEDRRCSEAGWIQTEVARGDRIGGFTLLEPLQPVFEPKVSGSIDQPPSGAIMFYLRSECPPGWSEFVAAQGRAVVGLQVGGTLGGTYGAPLSNLEERTHKHTYSFAVATDSAGSHHHIWSSIQSAGGDVQWTSYTGPGNPTLVFAWTNGIGNEGSGIFPLAAHPNDTFYTNVAGSHNHIVTVAQRDTTFASSEVPYIQLLACQKD